MYSIALHKSIRNVHYQYHTKFAISIFHVVLIIEMGNDRKLDFSLMQHNKSRAHYNGESVTVLIN